MEVRYRYPDVPEDTPHFEETRLEDVYKADQDKAVVILRNTSVIRSGLLALTAAFVVFFITIYPDIPTYLLWWLMLHILCLIVVVIEFLPWIRMFSHMLIGLDALLAIISIVIRIVFTLHSPWIGFNIPVLILSMVFLVMDAMSMFNVARVLWIEQWLDNNTE